MSFKLLSPFLSHKYLMYQLLLREIKARYKQSIVGYFWVILNPFVQLLVYTFVFSIVFRFPTDIPYPLYLLAALLPWTFLQTSVMAGTTSLVENSVLLKKVQFPREIIPYTAVFSKIIDFAFASFIFFIFVLFYRMPIPLSVVFFPLLFIVQLLLVLGLSLMLSALNLFYRDVQYLINLVLMVWLYLSPVVYPVAMVPLQYQSIYKINPLVGIIEGYRSLLFGLPIEWGLLSWSIGSSLFVFIFGFALFKKTEKVFADIV